MRTTIELTENSDSAAAEAINSVRRAQNRIRHPKKRIIDKLNETIGSVIKHTNDENIDNNIDNNNENLVNNSGISRQSIGKWMYENDDFLEEVAIDLSATQRDSTAANESDDEVVFIDSFSAGPSGLNVVNNIDSIKDCDLTPTLMSNPLAFDEVLYNMNDEDMEALNVMRREETETITIDDSIVIEDISDESTAEDDIEIIQVKYLNEPLDSDIEVLSEILSPQEVIDAMKVHLKNAQSLTKLSFTTIRLLMSKYQWNKDLFVNAFFEVGIDRLLDHFKLVINYELKTNGRKPRKIRRNSLQNSIQSSVDTNSHTNSASAAEPQELKKCLVCFDEYNPSEVFAANCGHSFCIDCWNQYIDTHVSDRSSDEWITCPGDNCPNIVDDDDLMAIIREKKTFDKYQRLISNNYVQKNTLLKWCPNGDCLHAVRVKENGFQDVECICKTVFCFLCGDRWHEPLSCQQHQNWIQKYASQTVDSQSVKWLTQHTKCCPKCRFPIEKNGGCNYVMCLKCRHQFCYNCLGRCSHGRCLGQNAPDAIAAQVNDHLLKTDLQIYPTIKGQYQKQSNRFAIEDKLQKDVSLKLEKAVKCPEFKSALKFLKSAFTVLCHCRQTLMYSYVFGYYLLGPPNHKAVYTQYLNQLEGQTEYLSKVLTTETAVIQKDSVLDIKRKVQPIYKECESNRSELVRHIRQGLAQNCWQFSAL